MNTYHVHTEHALSKYCTAVDSIKGDAEILLRTVYK